MSRTECPDCGSPLKAIKLTDATNRVWGQGSHRVNQQYAPENAEGLMGGFLAGIAPEGNVYGRLCPDCGRILLYAVPMNTDEQ